MRASGVKVCREGGRRGGGGLRACGGRGGELGKHWEGDISSCPGGDGGYGSAGEADQESVVTWARGHALEPGW